MCLCAGVSVQHLCACAQVCQQVRGCPRVCVHVGVDTQQLSPRCIRLPGHLQPFSSWGQSLRSTVPWVPLLSSVLHIKTTQQLKKGSCDSPTLLMRKLRLREVKDLSEVTGHAETGLQPRHASNSTACRCCCFLPLGSLTLQAFQIIPLHPCLSPPCRAGPGGPRPAQRTVVSHLLPGPSSCIDITHRHTTFSSNHTPINSHGASSSAVPGAADKAAHPTPLLHS